MKRWTKMAGRGLFAALLTLIAPMMVHAQNIGWEGETGVFVTPLAYVVSSPANSFSHPYIGFHYLGAGSIIGDFYETSVTEGAFGRTEFGYTRNFLSHASDPNLSYLWNDGFNIAFGKINIVPENWGKHDWIPAFSVGGMGRWDVDNVGAALFHKKTNNGDVYGVATKTILSNSKLPVILTVASAGRMPNCGEWEAMRRIGKRAHSVQPRSW